VKQSEEGVQELIGTITVQKYTILTIFPSFAIYDHIWALSPINGQSTSKMAPNDME